MKCAFSFAMTLALAAGTGFPSIATARADAAEPQQAAFLAKMKEADREINLAHFVEAKKLYEEALAEGKKSGVSRPDLAVVLSDIAMIEKLNFHYEEAQNLLFDALPLAGDDETLAALIHTRLSSVLRARGNVDGALEHAKSSVEIRRKLDPKSPLVAESLNNVAVLALDARNSAEAIDYCDQALVLLRANGKSGSVEEAAVMNSKSAALIQQGKFDQAIALLTEAVATQEKTFGGVSPKLVVTLNNLAMAIFKTGRHKEAEPYLKRALQLAEASKPQDIAAASDACANLAVLYERSGDRTAADQFFQRAITYAKSINYRNLADIQDQYNLFKADEK